MFRAHGGALVAGKLGYVAGCLLAATVLLVSGYAFHVERQLGAVSSSNVDVGGPQVGDMNILLMGLESRTYWNGEPLPKTLEDIMHVGSIGGDTTNTLILLHIYDNGKKALGFSIPRDDVVTMYGTHGYGGTTAKIDEAYGDALDWELQQLQQNGQAAKLSRDQLYFEANEAGRAAEIQTVEALTGVHIDHFAELNLWGFYELANIFGPIEVCLTQPAYDPDFSGANIPAGYHALSAAQALAFVRQRENLPNGDLDRTHRQQAVLDYVIYKVKHQNLISDLVEGNTLLNDLKTFMITSGGWNIVQFATEMQNLTGSNLSFTTLPIQATENNVMLNGRLQDINIIDPGYIKQVVHDAFYPAPAPKKTSPPAKSSAPIPPPSTVIVDVYNGGTATGLATHVSEALGSAGYKAGTVGNGSAQSETVQSATQVFYSASAAANAAKIAGYFGAKPVASSSLPAGHVEVLLGTAATAVPAGLGSAATSSGAAGSTPATSPSSSSAAATSAANNGQAGGAVTVKPNARYGIPCVN
jgi:LCP family protein required for cell wall assembly